MLHNLYSTDPTPGRKFVALFADGSGADLFRRDKQGNYYNTEGELLSQTWLEDAGYLAFMYLPDYFTFWSERNDAPI